MADPKKVANNILDFLIDPTRIPVEQRVYFRPEENLKNDVYENAKADAAKAYKNQKFNSDFYPNKNRQITQREATLMDRKSLIASFDILSRNFSENDPIGKDLRTMAAAVSKMSEEEFSKRQASDAPDFEGMQVEAKAKTFPCPKCGTKVLEATSYCIKCKKKVKPGKKAADEEEPAKEDVKKKEEPTKEEPAKEEPAKEEDVEASVQDFWTKEAMGRVAKGLVFDVLGMSQEDEDVKEEKKENEVEAKKVPEEAPKDEKVPEVPKDEVEAKKVLKEEEVKEANKKAAVVEEEKAEEKLPEQEEKKSTVDTDILASIAFGDISLDAPIIEAGDMNEKEKAKLAGLFN